jgi:integrase
VAARPVEGNRGWSARRTRERPSGRSEAGAPQTRAVLKAAQDHRLYALYVLTLCLGLRRGELLGLGRADVDLEVGKLEVVQSLQRVAVRLQFVRLKTSDSERTVPLPPICVETLREHRRKQFTERSDRWEELDGTRPRLPLTLRYAEREVSRSNSIIVMVSTARTVRSALGNTVQ